MAAAPLLNGCNVTLPLDMTSRDNALRAAKLPLSFLMPTETSTVDAEDLKSRVRELRRFL